MKKLITLLGLSTALLQLGTAQALTLTQPLVDSAWLQAHMNEVVVVDIRKDIESYTAKPILIQDQKSGKLELKSVGGHLPNATLIDYGKIRVTRVVNGKKVDSLIPEKAAFEKLVQAAGINQDSAIVIVGKGTDDNEVTMATRLYWQLKYFGQDNMAILDGGMAQWLLEKRPISIAPPKPTAGNWQASAERKGILASSEEVEAAMKAKTQLVDARPLAQYLGVEKKSSVSSKGHIPGAKPYPTDLAVSGSPAKFVAVNELRELVKGMGINANATTITYCNTGHLASGDWFVLHELLGNKNVKLYDGSMHEWTLEGRPTTSFKME